MIENKKYELGVVCGRFGHAHLGHVSLFNQCIEHCEKTLILVGSAQESGTLRNPFKIETRIKVIKHIYSQFSENVLIVRGINDLTNEYDITYEWGKFVKSEVERHMNKFADLMVYGNDEYRDKWFDIEDLKNTHEIIVQRNQIPISATLVRGLMLVNDIEGWKKVTHPNIHNMYERLREELLNVPIYKEIYDKIKNNGLSLEKFIEIYKVFEEKDKKEKLDKIKK